MGIGATTSADTEAIVATNITKTFGEGENKMTAVDDADLVAHFGDRGDGGRQIFGQFATDRIELQTHRNFLVGGGESQGRHRAGGYERPSGNA